MMTNVQKRRIGTLFVRDYSNVIVYSIAINFIFNLLSVQARTSIAPPNALDSLASLFPLAPRKFIGSRSKRIGL